jgi:hypothetical protein
MRILSKRVLAVGTTVVAVLVGAAALFWLSLTHEPSFYRAMVRLPRAKREAKAKRFVSQSLQRSTPGSPRTW